MKNSYWILAVTLFSLWSCGSATNQPTTETKTEAKPMVDLSKDFPANVWNIFEAHGGLAKWKAQQSMEFKMGSEEEGWETQYIDLWSRKTLIKTDKYAMGYDGENIWLAQDSTHYQNDPKFYYNLMFYFYAMPFVLADDGITYTDVAPVTLLGKEYKGVKISYGSGVGTSPDDEYIAYYDPNTKKMEWLAYTVTYFSKKKSPKFNILNYEEWTDTNGFLLPKKAQFYRFDIETGELGEKRGDATFVGGKVMAEAMPAKTFAMPEGAEVTE